jgi:Na+/melibiose symporter-like transporter
MLQHLAKPTLAVAGWVLAVTLMVVATTGHDEYLRGWSVLVAMAAWIPTHAIIVCHAVVAEREMTQRALREERLRTEQLIQAVAVQFASREVPRIRPDRTTS